MSTSRLIAYSDSWVNFSDLAASQYDTIILAFLLPYQAQGGLPYVTPWDMVDNAGTNNGIKTLKDAGKTVLVSFGGDSVPQEAMKNLFASDSNLGLFCDNVARLMAGGTVEMGGRHWDFGPGFDGIDFDLEGFASYTGGPETDKWAKNLATLTLAVRQAIGRDKIITHAPQTPYMLSNWSSTSSSINKAALYTQMMDQAGDQVDWLNVQFYANGETTAAITLADYTALNAQWPGKIALGKPLNSATAGYLDPATLCQVVSQAAQAGHYAGTMVWEFILNNTVSPSWAEQLKRAQS